MDLAALAALRSAEGRAVLTAAGRYGDTGPLAVGERLRREHPADLVAAAMTQMRLRERARGKFGADAAQLLFTADGLEQATRAEVAARHAQRLAGTGARRVVDLGCGLGADTLALARAGLHVTAVDRDPVAVALTAANAAALGLGERVTTRCADVAQMDRSAYDAVFCDPARRRAGRRTLAPDDWSPPWSFVAALLAEPRPAGVKVAPGIAHDLVPGGVEAEWVSVGGDVVEATLWAGAAATGVRRRATVLPAAASLTGSGAEPAPPVREPGGYLYEPDGAVIRAGLVAAVAAEVDGGLLDPTIAYVTADRLVGTPFAAAYEVLDGLPFGLKRLRSALRERGVGDVVVKKRGSAVEPEDLRRRLRLPGGGQRLTVVLTRRAGRPWVLLVRPAAKPPP